MQPTFQAKKLDSRVEKLKLGTSGAAAFDLQAARIINDDGTTTPITETIRLNPGQTIKIGAGYAIHMKRKDVGALIIPRSGRGSKGLVVGNLVGLIDSDYQGELIICLWNRNTIESQKVEEIKPLERIAQLMLVPVIQAEFEDVDDFSETSERGEGGFGSSGTH